MSPRNRLQAPRGHGYLLPFCITSSYLRIVGGNELHRDSNLAGVSAGSEAAAESTWTEGWEIKPGEACVCSPSLPRFGTSFLFFFLEFMEGEGGEE